MRSTQKYAQTRRTRKFRPNIYKPQKPAKNRATPVVIVRTLSLPELQTKTVPELRHLAARFNIPHRSKLNKFGLIDALVECRVPACGNIKQ